MKITKKDFLNVSDESFEDIIKYLDTFKTLIENVFDFHFEKTEEDLFNWIHADSDETPIDIKNSLMPQCMVNVLHVKEGWFYWYI